MNELKVSELNQVSGGISLAVVVTDTTVPPLCAGFVEGVFEAALDSVSAGQATPLQAGFVAAMVIESSPFCTYNQADRAIDSIRFLI